MAFKVTEFIVSATQHCNMAEIGPKILNLDTALKYQLR